MKTLWIALFALIGACTAQSSAATDAANPIVVELYQSQGCSSCPPADAVLNALADRADVLALSFAVTIGINSAGKIRSPARLSPNANGITPMPRAGRTSPHRKWLSTGAAW